MVFPAEPLTFGAGPAGLEANLGNSISDATWTGPVTLEPGGNNLVAEPTRTLRLTGLIGGPGGFRHIATGTLEFAGTALNTYAGVTAFGRGTFRLNKPAGVTALPGDLAIGTNDAIAGVVILMANLQIDNDSAVSFAGGGGFFGTLNLNGFTEQVGSLSGVRGHVLVGGAGRLLTGANDGTFGGDITGTGGLTKLGSGTFTLTGASSYTGPTTVSQGNLRVNGSIISGVTVEFHGTLSGSGTTGPLAASLCGATVSPGTSAGILTAGSNVALDAGSSFVVDLNGTTPSSGHDQLRVIGAASTVSLGGDLRVQLGFAPAGQSFIIINNGGVGPVSGTLSGLPKGALVPVGTTRFRISYRGGDGNDVVLTHVPGLPRIHVERVRQFGSPESDIVRSVAADGHVYLAGDTYGTLPGQTSAGFVDAFVRKYDAAGNVLWTRQFGTFDGDIARSIVVDASGVYVAGSTAGTLASQTSAGGSDAFVRKYDAAGNVLWTRQFGTSEGDIAKGIVVDASGLYVAGQTYGTFPGQTSAGGTDAFVAKIVDGSRRPQVHSDPLASVPAFAISGPAPFIPPGPRPRGVGDLPGDAGARVVVSDLPTLAGAVTEAGADRVFPAEAWPGLSWRRPLESGPDCRLPWALWDEEPAGA